MTFLPARNLLQAPGAVVMIRPHAFALNPETQAMYEGNILRVVPELVYSPYATAAHFEATGTKANQLNKFPPKN